MNYTGITNQIHFYDNNIDSILISDIDINELKKISCKINKEIENNKKTKEKIKMEKEKIISKLELIIKMKYKTCKFIIKGG